MSAVPEAKEEAKSPHDDASSAPFVFHGLPAAVFLSCDDRLRRQLVITSEQLDPIDLKNKFLQPEPVRFYPPPLAAPPLSLSLPNPCTHTHAATVNHTNMLAELARADAVVVSEQLSKSLAGARGRDKLLDYVSTTDFVLAVDHAPDYMTHIRPEISRGLKKLPILSMSADGDTTAGGAAAARMFEGVQNLRGTFGLDDPHGHPQHAVLRLFDIYIRLSENGEGLVFMFTLHYRDEHTKAHPIEVKALDSVFWQAERKKAAADGSRRGAIFRSSYDTFIKRMQPYLINLIRKHYLLPEILSILREKGRFVRIQFDHYVEREALRAKDFPSGFHKDTVSCNTFRVVLSFQNQLSMYGAEIIQCHSTRIEKNRCRQVVRLRLPPYGSISFNDFLLAHASPCVGKTGQVGVLPSHPATLGWENDRRVLMAKKLGEWLREDPSRSDGEVMNFGKPRRVLTDPSNVPVTVGRAKEILQNLDNPRATTADSERLRATLDHMVKTIIQTRDGKKLLKVDTHPAFQLKLNFLGAAGMVRADDKKRGESWHDEEGKRRSAPAIRRPPFFRQWFEVCGEGMARAARDETSDFLEGTPPVEFTIPIARLFLDAGTAVLCAQDVRGAISTLLSDDLAPLRLGGMKKKKTTRKRRRRKKRRKTKRRR